MERAVLVTIKLKSERDNWSLEDLAEELEELTNTSGAQAVDNITCICEKPAPNFFIGRGKTEEIALLCQEQGIDTVIFSRDLSGTQQRNLEEIIQKKTIDRTQLILDIFAQHARSPEGKMQVELAQLQYLLPRLVGKGVILSRLGGGIGTRGPGEQKLEIDRRRVRKRIEKLKDDLKHLILHRQTIRKRRKEKDLPMVTLVGYTNAGKSTLLNTLTNADQVVEDSMFSTLDPLSKGLKLPNGENIIISDTVGFLHNLPHHLIEAFKATLEEVKDSDLLIHVLDVSHPKVYEHNKSVLGVLFELGAQNKPILTALNKIDQMEDSTWLSHLKQDFINSVCISAKFKQNIDIFVSEIQKFFASKIELVEIKIPYSRMDLVNLFYQEAKVIKIKYLQRGIKIKLNLPKTLHYKLLQDKDIDFIKSDS